MSFYTKRSLLNNKTNGFIRWPCSLLQSVDLCFGFEVGFINTAERANPIFRQISKFYAFYFFVIDMTANLAYVFHKITPYKFFDAIFSSQTSNHFSCDRIQHFHRLWRLQYAYAASTSSPSQSMKQAFGSSPGFRALRWLPCLVWMATHSM